MSPHPFVLRLALVTVIFAGTFTAGSSWGALSYEGSVPIGELIIREAAKRFEAKTKIKFTFINTHGSGEAFRAVREGTVAIGGVARELTPEERAAQIHSILIGYDTLGIFVNENNVVGNLTKAQVKDIFTGKITNWKETGGTDAPIKVLYDSTPGRTVNITFRLTALDGQTLSGTPVEDRGHLAWLNRDVHVITFDSLPFQTERSKTIAIDGVAPIPRSVRTGAYPLSRPLFLICSGDPKGERQKFFDFILSREGQRIVAQVGFIPVK
jgi:phosphate transport system substrate-binding protein